MELVTRGIYRSLRPRYNWYAPLSSKTVTFAKGSCPAVMPFTITNIQLASKDAESTVRQASKDAKSAVESWLWWSKQVKS